MTDAAPEIGTRFGPYLLKRLLGSGGMGRVYEAEDTAMDRVVALKLISSTYAQDPEYRKRLQREARIAGRLQDPHVVPIHGAGEIDGQLYVDMRLINGTDLESILRRTGALPPHRAVSIARQVASALDAAHGAGVLHRDVKPANILITADDFAYLVDFGIANAATEEKLTQMGDVLGTWAYMAPERFDDSEVTPRSDVYALTCVLYEMLTGAQPFGGDRMSVIAAHLSQPIPRASFSGRVPEAFDHVISRGMAKNPADRYATAGELARAAEAAAAASPHNFAAPPTEPVPPGPTERIQPTYQSNPGLTAPPGAQYPQRYPNAPYPNASYPTGSYPAGSYPAGSHQPGSTPPPKRRKWIPIAIAAALVVAIVIGVGIWQFTRGGNTDTDAQGEVTTSGVDISTLDVGDYDTEPRDLSGAVTEDEGRLLYAIALAEGMPNPYDVDPAMNYVYGVPAVDPAYAATTISGTSTPLTQPAMEKYGMISGYVVSGYTVPIDEFIETQQSDELMADLITAYPNPDAAARAAKEMEAIDFDLNPDNQRIDIPGFPDALAHYRPGWSSIGATMASGNYVISLVVASFTEPDINVLVERVRKTLEIQVPLLDKIFPAAEATLTMQERDPGNVLSRAFVVGDTPAPDMNYAAYGPVASLIVCSSNVERRRAILEDAGVDACAITPDSQLLRAKDEESAAALVPELVDSERVEFVKDEIASPDGLPDVKCFEQKDDVWADNEDLRYFCYLSFDRYVSGLYGSTETDVHQRAAAQYAILVNA